MKLNMVVGCDQGSRSKLEPWSLIADTNGKHRGWDTVSKHQQQHLMLPSALVSVNAEPAVFLTRNWSFLILHTRNGTIISLYERAVTHASSVFVAIVATSPVPAKTAAKHEKPAFGLVFYTTAHQSTQQDPAFMLTRLMNQHWARTITAENIDYIWIKMV